MAIGSTIYSFDLTLSDTSRSVYEGLSLRLARHSSETLEFLLCRLLAYCLEYTEGLEFSKGLYEPETPAIWARNLTGDLTHWIEVGNPSAEKLHKASKNVKLVAIYTHKNPKNILQELAGQKIYRSEEIPLFAISPKFLAELEAVTERSNKWDISINDGVIYVDTGDKNFSCEIETYALA